MLPLPPVEFSPADAALRVPALAFYGVGDAYTTAVGLVATAANCRLLWPSSAADD